MWQTTHAGSVLGVTHRTGFLAQGTNVMRCPRVSPLLYAEAEPQHSAGKDVIIRRNSPVRIEATLRSGRCEPLELMRARGRVLVFGAGCWCGLGVPEGCALYLVRRQPYGSRS